MRNRILTVLVVSIAALASSLFVSGCGTAQYTNRSQLLLLSQDQEIALGLQAYQETLQSERLYRDARWTTIVERCGQRIAVAADKPEYQWEFKVIDSDTVNAFCLPGGKVAFYRGILDVCQDENGVAVVMGHEVAHALNQHGNERVSRGMVSQLGVEVITQILAGQAPQQQAWVGQALGMGTSVAVELPFSRSQESEADYVGLILMAKAGYDPRVAPAFWRRMAALGGSRGPAFLSTHPDPEARADKIEEWMPEAMEYYRAAGGR